MARRFTHAEAQSMLPDVGRLLREALASKSEYDAAEREIQSFQERVMMMGADFYQDEEDFQYNRGLGIPNIGIGKGSVIRRAIIDKNARIADGVVITPEGKPDNFDSENYFIRDGIVVVPKNAVIPAGFWI